MPPPMTAFGIISMFFIDSPPVVPPPMDSNPIPSGPAPTHVSRRGMTAAELYSNRLIHWLCNHF